LVLSVSVSVRSYRWPDAAGKENTGPFVCSYLHDKIPCIEYCNKTRKHLWRSLLHIDLYMYIRMVSGFEMYLYALVRIWVRYSERPLFRESTIATNPNLNPNPNSNPGTLAHICTLCTVDFWNSGPVPLCVCARRPT